MRHIAYIILPLMLTGCDIFLPENLGTTELIEYRAEDYAGDRLAIHGLLSVRDGVMAEVTVTRRPGTEEMAEAKNLHVYLVEEGEVVAELMKRTEPLRDSTDFTANFPYSLPPREYKMRADKKYGLRATAEGLPTAESEMTGFPEATIEVDTVEVRRDEGGYYRSLVLGYRTREDGVAKVGFARWYNKNKVFLGDNRYPFTSIESHGARGQYHEMFSRGISPYRLDSVRIEELVYTEGLAAFYKSIEDADMADLDAYSDRTVNVRSNVRGGYGYVGSYTNVGVTIVADSVNHTARKGGLGSDERDEKTYDPYYTAY